MKRLFVLSPFIFISLGIFAQLKKKAKVEEVKPICEGLAFADKTVVAISTFKLGATGASQQAGTGLSDMLMNAMLNSGCFRVVERERMNDILKEQGLGISGAGDEASFAKIGQQIGAQILIMGTVTEFTENESGGGGGAGGLTGGRRLGAVLGGVGAKTAHLGFTLRFVSPTTGEVIDMKSFDKKRTSVGAAAGGLFGRGLAGGTFYSSKSMQDLIEEGLIEAVEFMSKNKANYMGAVSGNNANAKEEPKVTRESCVLLKEVRKLKIMVMIPEEHLAGFGSNYDPKRVDININSNNNRNNNTDFGNSNNNNNNTQGTNSQSNNSSNSGTDAVNSARNMFRPPDPAGETEIMKRFLEFGGFDLVDAKQFEKLKSEKEYLDAFDNPAAASKIGSKFGADIIIVGEAFSEYSKTGNGMSSCRARVEVKAIMTKNARILAAEGLHGSGMDVSEVIAGKTALRNAGSKIADYFLAQLCSKAEDISADLGSKQAKTNASVVNEVELKFNNTDFNKATSLAKLIESISGVSKSERISFANKTAVYKVAYSGDINKLVEKIAANKAGIKVEINSVNSNSADIDVK